MDNTDTDDTLGTFLTELPHFCILVKVHVIAIHVANIAPPPCGYQIFGRSYKFSGKNNMKWA